MSIYQKIDKLVKANDFDALDKYLGHLYSKGLHYRVSYVNDSYKIYRIKRNKNV
jgi:hypothetical protein